MWTVVKINSKKFKLLSFELKKKFGTDLKIYSPRISFNSMSNNKKYKKKLYILGDYIFCHHKNFSNNHVVNSINYIKGVKYLLGGLNYYQNEIKNFINVCKSNENSEGSLNMKFYNLLINKTYKIISGPFTNNLFKIIEVNKNKINAILGNNLKITLSKNTVFI